MTHVREFAVEFVEFIPGELRDAVLYVSMQYATATHACACGCGNKVVTPLSPTDWSVTFDGESVSLDPSVGNWSFPCRSHYWIHRNRVTWARGWSDRQVRRVRSADARAKRRFFEGPADRDEDATSEQRDGHGGWKKVWSRFSGKGRRK